MFFRVSTVLAIVCALAPAATLEKLSLDEMIQKSTAIVRGRAGACSPLSRGPIIFTQCAVSVIETLKGKSAAQVLVATPGGSSGRLVQTFSGAPRLAAGEEYVLFLWTGSSGLTQVLGLSQGVFQIEATAGGTKQAVRSASSEQMLDAAGNPVIDRDMRVGLDDLRQRIGLSGKVAAE